MKKAIFLDRDGTINIDKGYVYQIEDFEFIERVPEAIAEMKRLGYLVIVLSNQSGVARGYYGEKDVIRLHKHINEKLKEFGAMIDGFYFCPHHLEASVPFYRQRCNCRKPEIGMLRQAIQDFAVNIGESWVVGDRERDLFLEYDMLTRRVLLTEERGMDLREPYEKGYLQRKNLWEFVQKDLLGEDRFPGR